MALDNGQRSPRKLLRAVIARLLGRKSWTYSHPGGSGGSSRSSAG
jgi:hypothetical protein